ncbi:MAG: leucine--tRNA ligase [Deltaproteobacteria bacterium]|nr:leucine--tRNA ligase [Deltaproteobacteria bacterium]
MTDTDQNTYTPSEVEAKWAAQWEANGLYRFDPNSPRPKFYWLTMFPYPSGDLHIGHWYAIAPSDAGARFKRMKGFNVFFPMGFDAFGLPAENAAIKNNIHPKDWTYKNIERMRGQLKMMGAMFAWDHEVITCEPDYYRWSQWIFLKLFEKELAYREFSPVDFCPSCNTTLAREQVVGEDKVCERCSTPVEKRALNQWKLAITRYAQELLDFSGIEWPEAVRTMQTNWIGRSEGVEFKMALTEGDGAALRVFTTRPDTLFGVTFCVISPEHPLVEQITTPENKPAVEAYRKAAASKTDIERMADNKEKDGVFTGAYALHPFTGQKIPVWVADYVLMDYGTGAIMAVPAHDTRDRAFARRYGLPCPVVLKPQGSPDPAPLLPPEDETYTAKEGSVMVNSGEFTGLVWPESFNRVAGALEAKKVGKRSVNYRLRDWLISRQRMWGTPIPIIHCKTCGTVPVPYQDLPVRLPDDAVFKPTGESPLKDHAGFLHVNCPRCGQPAQRETDTMDTFICSSWYMYAYLSPYWKKGQAAGEQDTPWDLNRVKQWLPVDQYTGGIEHAILHLLYVRFFAMALADVGALPVRAPVMRLVNQGIILGEDNEKMSKSRGNVVAPDPLVKRHGADAMRAFLMFIGPWDQGAPWNSKGIEGVTRFLADVWSLARNVEAPPAQTPGQEEQAALRRLTHQTIRKVEEDYGQFKFNTLLASLMAFRNELKTMRPTLAGSPAWEEAMDALILMLAPVAPYLTEELWQRRHPGPSVHLQAWPSWDATLAQNTVVSLVVQVNGKVKDKLHIAADTPTEGLEALALASPKVREALEGKTVRKVIPIGGKDNRLVNIVAG